MTRFVHTDAEVDLVDGARYYQEQAGDVWIMAVAHQSRRPNYWMKRK